MTELEELKMRCEERDSQPRLYTDAELQSLLDMCGGNIRRCAYEVLIRKAEASGMTLPDGTVLPDQSRYYLRLAARVRGAHSHNMPRADDIPLTPPEKDGDAP